MKISLLFVAAAAAALGLALGAPLAVTVGGLIAFGALHNVLELRYVAGRFSSLLTGRFLVVLLGLVTAIVLCRLAALVVGDPARYAEILVGYGVLAAACVHALRGARLVLGLVVLVLAASVSLAFSQYHFVVLAHLHNVVPLFFLWEWAGRLRRPGPFRWTQVAWVLVLPVLVLAGAFDFALRGLVSSPVVASIAPPGSSALVGTRFLVVFAFLQTMHYFVWVFFLPRYAPEAPRFLLGRRAWLLGLGLAALLAIPFAIDYATGRALYGAFASYHAYLEFPVLLAAVAGGSQPVFRKTASGRQVAAAV
ncbi:hypothetical protein ACQP1P_46360 [Dactylosporangium sp. CA-052675]|uniref:hypothetical protein n=1 Tax=Dactylosporangium sp. CA-052675 TaxID=3239927 RepID=UPI003D8EED1E